MSTQRQHADLIKWHSAGCWRYLVNTVASQRVSQKVVNIRFDAELLERIDAEALRVGLDRSSWIRLCCSQKLEGVTETAEAPPAEALVDAVEVVDERARDIARDLVRRVARLEQEVFSKDPFADS